MTCTACGAPVVASRNLCDPCRDARWRADLDEYRTVAVSQAYAQGVELAPEDVYIPTHLRKAK